MNIPESEPHPDAWLRGWQARAAYGGIIGGRGKSRAKARASKRNAKKGGWPKGRPRKPLATESTPQPPADK